MADGGQSIDPLGPPEAAQVLAEALTRRSARGQVPVACPICEDLEASAANRLYLLLTHLGPAALTQAPPAWRPCLPHLDSLRRLRLERWLAQSSDAGAAPQVAKVGGGRPPPLPVQAAEVARQRRSQSQPRRVLDRDEHRLESRLYAARRGLADPLGGQEHLPLRAGGHALTRPRTATGRTPAPLTTGRSCAGGPSRSVGARRTG